ncbi:nitroreductase family protein [Solwaraspora sp. WMMD406]|uniref:nitroreductase family protein n=1 Tax=Solwaraspora sp. WMMD406 TaxID=3016095 RepID=UPI00241799FD|nr:nitroreductase family protein [Solwaraspora sp. WMMD406]MDG4763966.1 nitroreductase family protein [Solwaraspora sp. WMMD406]
MSPTNPPDQAALHPLLAPADSTHRFAPETLNTAQLVRLIEAARWTPSKWNRQPWRFILGCRGDATFSLLRTALNPINQDRSLRAAALLLALAQTTDPHGVPMPGTEYELGMAVGRMCVQARAQGWQCRQFGGFDHQRLRLELGVPAGFEPIVVLAVGGSWPPGPGGQTGAGTSRGDDPDHRPVADGVPGDRTENATRLAPEAIAFARRWGRPAWTSS